MLRCELLKSPNRDVKASMGLEIGFSNRLGYLGSVVSSPSLVWGEAAAENKFQCFSKFPRVTECPSLNCLSQIDVLSEDVC